MRIAIGSDHRGFELKKKLIDFLLTNGHLSLDLGCDSLESADYPDFAANVANSILADKADYGILICGSGIGMSITANKYRGIRAALCCNPDMAGRARLHNDANVLCLGADFLNIQTALEIVQTFIATGFEGGRHQRRLDKISKIESVLLDNK